MTEEYAEYEGGLSPADPGDELFERTPKSARRALRLEALADLPGRMDRLEMKLDQILALLRGDVSQGEDQGAPEE